MFFFWGYALLQFNIYGDYRSLCFCSGNWRICVTQQGRGLRGLSSFWFLKVIGMIVNCSMITSILITKNLIEQSLATFACRWLRLDMLMLDYPAEANCDSIRGQWKAFEDNRGATTAKILWSKGAMDGKSWWLYSPSGAEVVSQWGSLSWDHALESVDSLAIDSVIPESTTFILHSSFPCRKSTLRSAFVVLQSDTGQQSWQAEWLTSYGGKPWLCM